MSRLLNFSPICHCSGDFRPLYIHIIIKKYPFVKLWVKIYFDGAIGPICRYHINIQKRYLYRHPRQRRHRHYLTLLC